MKPAINPECRDLKHLNCSGDAWNDFTNSPTKCQCLCHESLGGEDQ